MHRELARHTCVTLQLLWFEYREAHPDGYQYSRCCDRYREWRGRLDVVLRQVYRAGEKAFVDYAGPAVEVTDRRTGEIHGAKVFVGVLACALGPPPLDEFTLRPEPTPPHALEKTRRRQALDGFRQPDSRLAGRSEALDERSDGLVPVCGILNDSDQPTAGRRILLLQAVEHPLQLVRPGDDMVEFVANRLVRSAASSLPSLIEVPR